MYFMFATGGEVRMTLEKNGAIQGSHFVPFSVICRQGSQRRVHLARQLVVLSGPSCVGKASFTKESLQKKAGV